MQRAQAELLEQRARDDGEVSAKTVAKGVTRRFRRWRESRFGKMGPASAVRRIDPKTGKVL
jgi:hypothetical protein